MRKSEKRVYGTNKKQKNRIVGIDVTLSVITLHVHYLNTSEMKRLWDYTYRKQDSTICCLQKKPHYQCKDFNKLKIKR